MQLVWPTLGSTNTIIDSVGNPTATTFNSGETYVVNRADPAVISLVRADADPTSEATVDYTLTFSEPVSGVDTNDFGLVAYVE